MLETLERGKSIIVLGPRQTGKTHLVKTITHDRYINLMDPELRLRYESRSGSLMDEVKALKTSLKRKPIIIIDEIQKVPELTDSIQLLIDDGIGAFILTGSSARKSGNLLPGRIIKFKLDLLYLVELSDVTLDLTTLLTNGLVPAIATDTAYSTEDDLSSYVSLYLEEEIRKEALVRNLGACNNFLRLVCIESGDIVSDKKLSQAIGVSHSTVAEYYRILLDCMLVEKFEPLTISHSRRRLSKSAKYIVFDLWVRRL